MNEWWLITAAHVFENRRTHDYFVVRVGNNNHLNGVPYNVTKIVSHESYNKYNYKESDIALMKMSEPIAMKHSIQPICLPSVPYEEPSSDVVVVAGWGLLRYDTGSGPVDLQEVKLNIEPIEKCAQTFKRQSYKIYRSQICTLDEGKDACSGDSGGPAVDYVNGILVGIVSYDEYPGVYTKI
ncbi:unnamed protein product [Oppiella nova]|uniref:Peptidase S1 domain-containing protein n=1 Tax=Oppiella nova TaxID=334625 RepID=A0A7R9MKC9_9ACAR|nr:unnamed protein product [Oppiella nova]CAG2178994.1 unnamed protein product [Oppiella nova]